MGSDKGYYFGMVRVFWKKIFCSGLCTEAPQNNSEKLFWGVTLVILPRVARMKKHKIIQVVSPPKNNGFLTGVAPVHEMIATLPLLGLWGADFLTHKNHQKSVLNPIFTLVI